VFVVVVEEEREGAHGKLPRYSCGRGSNRNRVESEFEFDRQGPHWEEYLGRIWEGSP
jgi:hypothetical protein